MKSLKIKTDSNYELSATLFEPEFSNNKFLLINSATGVKQQMYFSFATFFAQQGFTVLTYDYYGIGESKPKDLKSCTASMKTWGSIDFKAVTDFLTYEFPSFEKYCLGHSVGALILGMNDGSQVFKKFLFVATQKAYVGNLYWIVKLKVYLGFGIAVPILCKLLGHFPAELFGIGESLPRNAALDWRTLLLNKKSTNKLLESTTNISNKLTQETLILHAEDDHWVTQRGIDSLLAETYPNIEVELRDILVSESEIHKIGHINFFRKANHQLWEIPLRWLSQ